MPSSSRQLSEYAKYAEHTFPWAGVSEDLTYIPASSKEVKASGYVAKEKQRWKNKVGPTGVISEVNCSLTHTVTSGSLCTMPDLHGRL